VRLVSYNIRYGGRGRERLLAAVLDAARPDFVALQEATDPGVVEQLARMLGFTSWGSRLAFSTGFLSRLPVTTHAWHHPAGARHAFLEIALEGGARVFALHLNAWFSKWSERRRSHEIRALLHGIQAHQHGPHVIVGDFNALAPGELLHVQRMPRWIQAMVWLSGRDIARDTIQHMLDARYVDAWRRLHPQGEGWTFPTWDPHVRLDYAFLPERDAERVQACEVLADIPGAREASDHFPLLCDLAL
jgi:endonuclease/exonuclease/phosphatase family metal-dependent hydrolase